MPTAFSGAYPLESRSGEIERLRTQSEAMASDTKTMLETIGVGEGWRCLDLGCGPEGIASLLAPMVGHTGRVLGLDLNEGFLAHARASAPANVEFRSGNVFQTGLAADSFDLVHARFVASTAGSPEALLAEAIRVARPGGVVALQEPDGSTLECYPPHPAWETLKSALLGAFEGVGADLRLARRLYSIACASGLADVRYRTCLLAVRSMDPMVDYPPSTVESLRATVIRLGLLTEAELDRALAECREHLRQPGTSFTMYTVAQVWGRK
ncbi:MAG: methyltransferase domain-containing protein [Bryobacteraceae bacterium]